MYELIDLSEHDHYVDCPSKIGIVEIGGGEVVLIDAGNDKDAGKKVLRILDAKGWKLKAIFNTHSHADHIGGNKYLQDRTGCSIYSKGLEVAYTCSPELEAMMLYGGYPFKELQSKFLYAQKSTALLLTEDVLPSGMKILELPGHSIDMVGYRTPDGNAFIGDCISSPESLEKHGISYQWDPETALRSLEYVKSIDANCFIAAHAEVCRDIASAADINAKAIKDVYSAILEACSKPCCFEEILQQLCGRFGISLSAQQYVLIGSTVRSYLSCLYGLGKIEYLFEDGRMLWRTAL